MEKIALGRELVVAPDLFDVNQTSSRSASKVGMEIDRIAIDKYRLGLSLSASAASATLSGSASTLRRGDEGDVEAFFCRKSSLTLRSPEVDHATARLRTASRMETSSFTCGGWNNPSGPCGLTSV